MLYSRAHRAFGQSDSAENPASNLAAVSQAVRPVEIGLDSFQNQRDVGEPPGARHAVPHHV
jgi:hypothetical protein